eukprot:g344.t1
MNSDGAVATNGAVKLETNGTSVLAAEESSTPSNPTNRTNGASVNGTDSAAPVNGVQDQPLQGQQTQNHQQYKTQKLQKSATQPPPLAPDSNNPPNQNPQVHGTPICVQTNPDTAPYRQLKVEDALEYLDKVKKQFGHIPEIYNRFLDIMKNFKAQAIDTPGVIGQVSKLFQGHNNLILGFNTFLPPGFKIELPHAPPQMPGGHSQQLMQPIPPRYPPQLMGNMNNQVVTSGTGAIQPPPPAFDKAVTYVTRIKERFSDDKSGTYKAFLDILHTYQREQRSIKDVLDKVADLFKHHPDLLEEFTYFLPDAVQDEAKVRLQRAARQIRARMGKAAKRGKDRRRRRKHLDDGYHLPEPERRFFQRVKSSIGKDQWGEFIKCLELYCQEVVKRQELLDLVSDLFRGKSAGLFDQFKRVLVERGVVETPMEEVWFSMPLSEIDFNNCHSCTPSYRALPAGYPIPACSDRTPEMMPLFNDCWVSVPTGSEDFAFKNSRKNAYEEALFRCEDERYEIDMVIEANLATIRLLEPLAEDVKKLREEHKAKGGADQIQYRLDRRSLSVTHLKAIGRIYADHGHEILELLRKNPAGAIPIILKRLKQKNVEWRRVRKELDKGWREVLKKNYTKSLDHRSFYFRQQDKKGVTTKYLLSDIKSKSDRQDKRRRREQRRAAGQDTDLDGESSAMDVDNTDEEVNSNTDGESSNAKVIAAVAVNNKEETLVNDGSICSEHEKPHICLKFSDVSLHRDLYALLRHGTLKSGSLDRDAKKRVAILWRSFLQPMLGIPKEVIDDEYAIAIGSAKSLEKKKINVGGLAIGKTVETPYGSGTVKGGRWTDISNGIIEVELCFGVAYMNKKNVREEDCGDAMDVENSGDDTFVASASDASETDDAMTLSEKEEREAWAKNQENFAQRRSFYCGSTLYLFARMYHVLYDRVLKAKQLCSEQRRSSRNFVLHPVEELQSSAWQAKHEHSSSTDYSAFLSLTCNLLDGTIGTTRFEELLQESMGTGSFLLFTIDKVVQAVLKQLHTLANNAKVIDRINLCLSECMILQHDDNETYRIKAEALLEQQEEDSYRVDVCDGIPAKEGEKRVDDDAELIKQKVKAGLPPPLPDTMGPKFGWKEVPSLMMWYKPFVSNRRPKTKVKKVTKSNDEEEKATTTTREEKKEKEEKALLTFGSKDSKGSSGGDNEEEEESMVTGSQSSTTTGRSRGRRSARRSQEAEKEKKPPAKRGRSRRGK